MTNYNIILVKWIPWSQTLPSRIKLISPRFKQSIYISDQGEGPTYEQAEKKLIELGFEIVGLVEMGEDGFGIVTNTFKELKQ